MSDTNDAEELLKIARIALQHRNELLVADGLDMGKLETVILAIRFNAVPPSLHLRAIVENWSRNRIVRELY